ncbi:uncharacterized protein LOC142168177 [Nicotiana tabacum]|uniref:Uncharacterized protein LOC142168177 n=1 Tax=Nicotiana tabacum TaxID=4097 RepID=A0AC58SIZ1_TOBAC
MPWLVGGDFNVVMHEDEKIGGLPVHPPEYEDFAFCVNSSGLFDLGYKGNLFLGGMEGLTLNALEHQIRIGSDHAPLLLSCGEQASQFVKLFKFLNFWTKHENFKEVVRQNCKETYGDIFKQLVIREDIVRVKEMMFEEDPTVENRIVLQNAQAKLKKYLSIEERYRKQKAGMIWFNEGDRNTRFLHNHMNGKRQKLQLKMIQNGDSD